MKKLKRHYFNEKGFKLIRIWALFGMFAILLCSCVSPVIFRTDFMGDPQNSGWTYKQSRGSDSKQAWVLKGGERYLSVAPGATWTSPVLDCSPFHYYRMTFKSKSDGTGYWAVFFYDNNGKLLAADDYSSVYPSWEWVENDVIFRCPENATEATVNFIGTANVIRVDDVRIELIDQNTVCKWADDLYKTLPLLECTPEPSRWKFIPKTMENLRTGTPVRIVMLGHSIMNDINNSAYEALIQRMYPKVRIRAVPSVRSNTGCDYFQKDEHIESYVADRNPDLLMILGIGTVEEIQRVIRKIRKRSRCEILLVSCPTYPGRIPDGGGKGNEQMVEFVRTIRSYSYSLKNLAEDEKIEYLDMAETTMDYFADLRKPGGWFQRDQIHANDRGKQILARIMEIYFSPKNRK